MPKVSDPQSEARHDIRKQRTREIYKVVKEKLESQQGERDTKLDKKDTEKNKKNSDKQTEEKKKRKKPLNSNLSKEEHAGLKSLQKRITAGD